MEISQETLEEYKEIYKEDFGKDITDADAQEIITRVTMLYQVLYSPLPHEKNPPGASLDV